MALGILDLSQVTDTLVAKLDAAILVSKIWNPGGGPPPFTVSITGDPPDTLPTGEGCQLSVFLFHVNADPYQRNSPVTGPTTGPPKFGSRVPALPFQPLSLDLYYMLTAYSAGFYRYEQQVMSMAIKNFYENPVVQILGGTNEFVLTLQTETTDEIGRLWQAIASPIRLSTLYKVSVVFISPPDPPALGPPVKTMSLSVSEADLTITDGSPQVFGTVAHLTYSAPQAPAPAVQAVSEDLFPASVSSLQTFLVVGSNLSSANVYLTPAVGPEIDITSWKTPALSTSTKLSLTVPLAAPPAGVYTLTVGIGPGRFNPVPISFAPFVTPSASPILPSAPTHSISGQGFAAGATDVFLETMALVPVGGVPGPGQFRVVGNTIDFGMPPTLPLGVHAVRVRVNGVEALPAVWVSNP